MATPSSLVRLLVRRFLLSKQSDGFLSFISGVSITGVAVGVLALVVVVSVINGFEGELTRAITGMNGEVLLFTRGNPISNPRSVEEKIRQIVPKVEAMTPSFVTELMVSGPRGVAGAVVEGIDEKTLGDVTTIPKRVRSGHMPENDKEVIVGSALADRIGVQPGDTVRLIVPFAGENQDTPRVQERIVSGILHMGFYQYDSKFLLGTLESVQKFLSQPGRVTTYRIKLAPGADAEQVSEQLAENFGYPFRTKHWGELNRNLFYAIKLEKAVIAVILAAIIIVAAFNVISMLMMMIHDKTREMAILKAMGFGKAASFKLFLSIGLLVGATGSFIGLILGLAINQFIARTHLIRLPADIYHIGFLPVVVRWNEVALICLLGIIISFGATVYPALQAARRSALEGLRYE
jgi:lipoprotein-releasing system permease protein